MRIGIPREIMDNEYRVSAVPAGVEVLVKAGHEVVVETQAGAGSGFPDEDYESVGAVIAPDADTVFSGAEMICKVKEPQEVEFARIRENQIVFTYFHFAAGEKLTDAMLDRGAICIAYETVEDAKGTLPLLTPMSEVAGRMSVQEGAKYLEKPMMGRGILLGGVPGVPPAKVTVLGGGVVGTNAAKIAAGLGAQVTVFDIDLERMRYLDDVMPANVVEQYSTPHAIRAALRETDLLIGAVLLAGAKAPRLVPREYLKLMQPGAVIVDVAIDQGGCVETARPTTHSEPTYVVDDVVHYCVKNMPGAVGRTSTHALTNATLRYTAQIAGKGWIRAAREDAGLARGINTLRGHITHEGVAEAFNREYTPIETLLADAE
ncbi:MAG: alanine dehydrogenase [Planctomycetota bacterium]|jgi:alanine dehydrogenase